MATPDRVTDELVELRYALYSNPEIRASLRTVFSNAFGTGAVPRRMVPEARLAEISAPTLVFWTDHNPGSGPGGRAQDRQLHPRRRSSTA